MTPLGIIFAGLGGSVAASFAATAAIRASRGEPFLTGRSHCDGCGRGLSFLQTAPVVSYAVSRGSCSGCGEPIDPAHFVGELAGGIGAALAFASLSLVQASLVTLMGLFLLAAAIFDWRTLRLPDALTGLTALGGLTLSWMRGWDAVWTGMIVGAVAGLVLWAVRGLTRTPDGKPGLGFGDVKLVAAAALWLGLATPWMICAAALLGLGYAALVLRRPHRFPFGPMIAFATWIVGWAVESGQWPALA